MTKGAAAAVGEARPGGPLPTGAATTGIIAALFGPGAGRGAAGALGGTRAREAARAAQVALQQLILRLSGCLSALPYEHRLALELSSGVGVARPLDAAAVAAYLHIGTARLALLEQGALHELVQAAGSGACGVGVQPRDGFAPLSSLQAQFEGAVAPGGAEASDFGARPARQAGPGGTSAPTTDPLLGIDIPSEARLLLIAVLAAASALLIWLLFSDRFELGTRFREWRFRRTHRPRA